jgi:adenosine kinase
MSGWPLRLCGLVGSLCATYVLEQVGTQSHDFTRSEFVERFRGTYDDEGYLDELLHSANAD